jgi:hypothetical protein
MWIVNPEIMVQPWKLVSFVPWLFIQNWDISSELGWALLAWKREEINPFKERRLRDIHFTPKSIMENKEAWAVCRPCLMWQIITEIEMDAYLIHRSFMGRHVSAYPLHALWRSLLKWVLIVDMLSKNLIVLSRYRIAIGVIPEACTRALCT